MTVTVQPRQTLADIAIQMYGDVRAVSAIAKANDICITDELTPGTVLKCPEEVYDLYLQNYVRKINISPATEIDPDGDLHSKIFSRQFTQEFK